MTLQTTKDQLAFLLKDKDNKVVTLSGKWGTGKSHLWGEVKAESTDEAVRNALYVSLFGLSAMNEIKLKALQTVVFSEKTNSVIWERVKVGVRGVRKLLASFDSRLSALDELALLAIPSLLKSKVVVLDDVERKHHDLSIDEVLGFLDEFSQQHGTRFVLILNSDKLEDKQLWETLREKVVDQEVKLNTTPSEAFDIALNLTPSIYMSQLRPAIERCGITNIRVIRKVIKAVNRILDNRQDLSDALLSRVVPSAVLLTAIHYKGIEKGPDFDFVLNYDSHKNLNLQPNKLMEASEAIQHRWQKLLKDLGIDGCDDYESLVVNFLESGLFDTSAVAWVIEGYAAENEKMTAWQDRVKFFEGLYYDSRLREVDLLSMAEELCPRVHFMEASDFTSFHEEVEKLQDGKNIAKDMLDKWISAFKAKGVQDLNDDWSSFRRKVHPAIQAEFDAVKIKAQSRLTVFGVCELIARTGSWGRRHDLVMKESTVADFDFAIRTRYGEDFKLLMLQMLEMTATADSYRKNFGCATDRFVEACKVTVLDPSAGRLSQMIKDLFDHRQLAHLLDSTDTGATVDDDQKPIIS